MIITFTMQFVVLDGVCICSIYLLVTWVTYNVMHVSLHVILDLLINQMWVRTIQESLMAGLGLEKTVKEGD